VAVHCYDDSTINIVVAIIIIIRTQSVCFLPADFFTRAAFDVRGALGRDNGDGELVSRLDLGTAYVSALVHINHTLRQRIHLQHHTVPLALQTSTIRQPSADIMRPST